MAGRNVSTSMSAELMQKLHPYGYKRFVAVLNEGDSISQEFFRASKWVNYFALDTSLTFRNGKVNLDHVCELFGSFNGLSGRDVHSYLLSYVCKNIDFFDGRGSVCLPLRGLDLSSWVDNIDDYKVCCDELALLGLSAMYQQHILVVTKNKFWSTIESNDPLSIIDLMKECSVHLLYLGNMKFGMLRWQPRNPQPIQPKPNLGKFDIVKEITLDDQLGESSTAEVNGVVHVDTVKNSNNITNDDQGVHPPSVQNESSEITRDTELDSPVETKQNEAVVCTLPPETEPHSPDVVIKKKAVLKIARLRAVDIDVWTDIVHKYYEFVPSHVETGSVPKIANVRGYGLQSAVKHEASELKEEAPQEEPVAKKAKDRCPPRSGPSPERLLAHANALISKVNHFITKPVNAKFGATTGKITDQTPHQHVETSHEVPSSQVETSESESDHSKEKPVKPKSHRSVKCKICKGVFGSIKDLNNHHRDDHGVVDCNLCDKKLETMSALEKHKYLHQDLKYICEDCGQSYPFKSRLKHHRTVHQNILNYMCKHKGCTRGFKNKGDFNRHLQSHLEGWYWCDTCTYKNKDKRNCDSHMRIHQQQGIGLEHYVCKQCGKAMRFNTQLRRHKKSGCQIMDLSVQKEKPEQSDIPNDE